MMDRRGFVKAAGLASVGAAVVSTTGCAAGDPAPASIDTPSSAPAFAFDEATVAGLQEQMASGALTSRALTQAYLNRIASIDAAGPTLRAVLEVNPEALTIADACDAERKAGKVRGPLHGIPVALKDNIHTTDMPTSGGAVAFEGDPSLRAASRDARARSSWPAASAV